MWDWPCDLQRQPVGNSRADANEGPLMNRCRTGFHAAAIVMLTATLLAACFTSPAGARFNMAEARQACTPDVLRLCSNYLSDRGRIVSCLKRNARSLGPGCHGALSGRRR
jgi:hypothetical protein